MIELKFNPIFQICQLTKRGDHGIIGITLNVSEMYQLKTEIEDFFKQHNIDPLKKKEEVEK